MRTNPRPHSIFWVNGHKCEYEWEHRAALTGYIDGEKACTGSSRKHITDELRAEAKYRPEDGEPDIGDVANATQAYMRSVDEWILERTIVEALFPERDSLGGPSTAVQVLHEAEEDELLEKSTIQIGRNDHHRIWRPTEKFK